MVVGWASDEQLVWEVEEQQVFSSSGSEVLAASLVEERQRTLQQQFSVTLGAMQYQNL